MCIAGALRSKGRLEPAALVAVGFLSLLRSPLQVQLCVALTTFVLCSRDRFSLLVQRICDSRPIRFLGDTSYAVYLCHELLLFPLMLVLYSSEWYSALGKYPKLIVAFLFIGIPVYAISYALHRVVEKPGIALGKIVLRRLSRGATSPSP
jgi:peptidoglycan/LPS O-acetylase OafA/YrhL